MSQISPPIRILLAAVVGLVAIYMLFLKPKDETVAPAAPPAAATPIPAKDPNAQTHSKPGAIVQGAVRDTQAASNRSEQAAGTSVGIDDGKTDGTTSVPSSTGVNTNPVTKAPATGQTATPPAVSKDALASLPKDVRQAVLKRKVLVMLFYNNRSADDLAVRRALAHVNHFGGQVFVEPHWIKNVSRFQAITRGVDVEQSPTVIVADANLKAETLVGYVDADTIDQAVADAIRASGGSILKDPYLRRLDSVCLSAKQQVKALAQPSSAAAVPGYTTGLQGVTTDVQKKVNAVTPPKHWRQFHKAFQVNVQGKVSLANWAVAHAPKDGPAVLGAVKGGNQKLNRQFVRKHGAHGLSCF